jgi:hypothetical protein
MSASFLPPPATYLGDSVYVRYEGWGTAIRLYLDNGSGAHTTIVLEPEVHAALGVWMKLLQERVEAFVKEGNE